MPHSRRGKRPLSEGAPAERLRGHPRRSGQNPRPPSLVPRKPPPGIQWGGAASSFAGIRRSSLWSLLEDSGETSFSNRNDMFRFEEEEPLSDTEFSQYHGSAETERATCAPTRFPGRVFAFFRRAAKEGRSRRSEIYLVLFPSFVPAAAGNTPVSRHCEAPKGAVAIRNPVPARGGQFSERYADSPFVSVTCGHVPSPPAGLFLWRQRLTMKCQGKRCGLVGN